jgi:putative ABC transport system permease protein
LFGLDQVDVSNIPLAKLKPDTVTAAYVGLRSKVTLFRVSRAISEYSEEAISAVVPSVALSELWSIVGMVDKVFKLLSWIVIGIALISMVTLTLSTLDARNREMAILRACGASPLFVSGLVLIESLLVSVSAIVLSVGLVTIITYIGQSFFISELGIVAEISFLNTQEVVTLLLILCAGLLSSLLPALMVYKRSLSSGLMRS